MIPAREPEFACRALGLEAVCEGECGSGAGGDSGCADCRIGLKSTEGEEAGGLVEAETRAKLAGGGADDSATECRIE